MDEQQHEAAPKPQRQPSPGSVITGLNSLLDEKKETIRELEDRLVWMTAMSNDLNAEIVALRAMVDQVTTENRILRKRLDLPEAGPLALTDEESQPAPESEDHTH